MKDNHFKLSNSFTSLFAPKEPSLTSATNEQNKTKSTSADNKLFRLNPKTANNLDDLPIDVLRRKSKNKLESLKDDEKKFSIFQQKIETKDIVRQKKAVPKKYYVGNIISSSQQKQKNPQRVQQALPFDIVRPSRLPPQSSTTQNAFEPIPKSTLFQTPLLPCFSSQFRHTTQNTTFKCLQQKQGVWKIGKIKMRGSQAKLIIGDMQFEAVRAKVAGRAGVVGREEFYQLANWQDIWVVQPSEELFQ